MVPRALEAAEMLAREGVSAEVVNCSAIALRHGDDHGLCQKTGRVVTRKQ